MSRRTRLNPGLTGSLQSAREVLARKANRMAHWDEQIGLPRGAVAAVPLLVLPMVVGSVLLLVVPASGYGTAAVIAATVALAWYLLGGAVALSQRLRQARTRKAVAALRSELADAPEAVWLCDDEGRILFQNLAADQRFQAASSGTILDVLGRLRADAEHEAAHLLRRAERVGTAELALNQGETLSLSCAADGSVQIWALLPSGAEPAFASADEAADGAGDEFEALPVPLLRLGTDGRIHQANAAARRLFDGRLELEPQDVHLGALFEGPGRALTDWITEIAEGRAESRTEMLRLRQPGPRGPESRDRHYQVALAVDPKTDDALIAVLTDISALKTLEAQFVQSQKMQAIGQLAGGVAHDFNNLLTAIRGHCDLLMLRRDKGDPDYADLDQISQNANRAAALVGQLLAFSRKQTLQLEPLDLRDTLADLTHLLNRLVGERIGLRITHDPKLRPIRADKRQLEQVIMNLVVNARDAMPEGGEICVRTENQRLNAPLPRDRVTLPAGDYVRITVTDQGCGIPPEILSKIFEPFFTTKRTGEGTGLGLSTAYGIVKQTGGYIFCDSMPGQGTCFSLYFPAHHAEPVAALPAAPVAAPRPAARPEPAETPRLLLVEDEAPVRAFAARALKLKGYEVLEADSAEAALEILRDPALRIDLFVTDVVMPGLDGPSWVREARKSRPQAGVIFMSGYTEDIFTEGRAPIANSAFLSKPFTLAELAQLVEDRLASSDMPQPRQEPARQLH